MVQIDLGKTQAQLDWLKQKLYLDYKASQSGMRIVKRGQVYECELGIGVGTELQKKRPCVILQNDIGNSQSSKTIVAPITHTYKVNLSCFVPISSKYDTSGSLILDGYVNVSEVRAIDKARICDYIDDLDKKELLSIDKAIALNLDIFHHYKTLENKFDDKMEYIEKLNAILSEIKEQLHITNNKDILPEILKLLDTAKEK